MANRTKLVNQPSLPEIFDKYKSIIDASLRQQLNQNHLNAYQLLRYAMGWTDIDGNTVVATEGKALRPTLCLLACESTGGEVSDALPAAIALELIHAFSLIHDEVQDRDETRRHRPTIWTIWGESKAIVAGNILRIIADISLSKLINTKNTAETTLYIADIITKSYLQMIEGQYLDLKFEGRTDITINDYLSMISRKTGALIECSLTAGAIIGSANIDTIESFKACGKSLGMVFQIRDDYLGIWGDAKNTGKPVGADIRRKKNAFPFVYCISNANPKEKKILLEIYSKPVIENEDVFCAIEIMERVGTKEKSKQLADIHLSKAISSISNLDLVPEFHQSLVDIGTFLLIRER